MREPGCYWVRYLPNPALPVEVARWGTCHGEDDRAWRCFGNESLYNDSDFEVLSERLLPPDWEKGAPLKSEA